MKLRRIATAFTFVGALIGAGFASGREVALYFADYSLITPLLSGVFLGAFCYLFLRIGMLTGGNPENLWGKGKFLAEFAVRMGNVVTCCAMVAGSEEAIFALFSFRGGGIITGILCVIVVSLGAEKIKLSNFLIVPAIIVMILVLFFKGHALPSPKKFSAYSAFSYCTMNVISGGYLVSRYSGDFTKKDCLWTAIIGGGILTGLLLCVYFAIGDFTEFSMPLMEAAKFYSLAKMGYVVLYLSVFTTLTTSLSVASKDKLVFSLPIIALSFLVSTFGFKKIVDGFYPILGAVGSVICIIYIILYIKRFRKINGTNREQPSDSEGRLAVSSGSEK